MSPTTLGLPWIILALLAVGVAGMAIRVVHRGRRRPAGPVPVLSEPPDGLRPGQLGGLVDERADTRDFTATVIDLAVRGYLKITELDREGGRPNWRIEQLESDPDLLRYEHAVVQQLFGWGAMTSRTTHRPMIFLSRRGRPRRDRPARVLLLTDGVQRGWYVDHPRDVRRRWMAAPIVIGVAGLIGAFLCAIAPAPELLPFCAAVVGLAAVGVFLGRRMPARTRAGAELLGRAKGFRRFVATVEAKRVKSEERPATFSRYLPYAIAFGVTDHWVSAFEKLRRDAPALDWYEPVDAGAGLRLDDFKLLLSDLAAFAATGDTGAREGISDSINGNDYQETFKKDRLPFSAGNNPGGF